MNTLDMPATYVPALEEHDALGKDVPMDSLPVDLMALIDDCSAEWVADDGEDLLAALGGESYEQALEEGVTLLDGGCGLIEEDVLDFVTEEIAAAPGAEPGKVEPQSTEAAAKGPSSQPMTPRKHNDPFFNPALSPFSLAAMQTPDQAGFTVSMDIWNKFDFPKDEDILVMNPDEMLVLDGEESVSGPELQTVEVDEEGYDSDMTPSPHLPHKNIPSIDWEAEMEACYQPEEKFVKRSGVMWSSPLEIAIRPKPMITPAQLRRKLLEEDSHTRLSRADADLVVTPDNSLPLANRSTTVPAASALKSRPMRSLLNTKQQQQQHVKTSSRSLLLTSARQKVQTAPSQTVVKQKPATITTCDPVPPAESSVEIRASRLSGSEDGTLSASSRPETPQSQTDSEDEAPVFRHNTIDTIFSSSLCDASASSVYLTPSDSSGSPKSTICDEDDDEDEEEDYDHQNLKSPPESAIREERPARTVLPYISDHSYHLSKSNVRIDGLGVQTPSDSEEEIDVVSVGGDKGTARLPNNPSARDRRQIQIKVATAIQRQSRQTTATTTAAAADAPSGSRKRQASATPARSCVKRTRTPTVSTVVGRGKGKATGAGRGRRRANADEEPDPCEKRSMHNTMERQRRIDLRNLVDRLRATVPALLDSKRAAKVVILREATKYCRDLAARSEANEAEKARLRCRQTELQRKLSALRHELAAHREQTAHRGPAAFYNVGEVKTEPLDSDSYQYYREF